MHHLEKNCKTGPNFTITSCSLEHLFGCIQTCSEHVNLEIFNERDFTNYLG